MKTAILSSLLLAISSVGASAGTISLVPSNATPTVGSSFTIQLVVSSNADEILGFGLDYSISTAAIGLTGSAIDAFFGADLGLGDPQLSAITFPGNTNATVNLVTFSFTANSVGSAVFRVISDLSDPNEGLFTLAGSPLELSRQVTVNVQAGTAVPEPSTFGPAALFGLVAMVVFHQRGGAQPKALTGCGECFQSLKD